MTIVTCPDCKTSVDIDSSRGFGFCVNCGKRLTVDGAGSTCTQTGTYSSLNVGHGNIRVLIIMPSAPAKISGSFNYFGIKWDGVDQMTRKCNETLQLDTTAGEHEVEIRQINGGLFGSKVVTVRGRVNLCSDSQIMVFSEDDHLVLRSGGYGDSPRVPNSDGGSDTGLSFR